MRLLVVEDDGPLREAMCAAATSWQFLLPGGLPERRLVSFTEVREADSMEAGIKALVEPVDVLLVDVRLGEKSGIQVAEHASKLDLAPLTLAISGQATAAEGFRLAALGVRAYLSKPFDMHELRAALALLFTEPPDLTPGARAQVGFRHVHTVQDEVKVAMLKRALTLEEGNITRAATRLGVTRTAVQQMLDRYGLPRSTGVSKQ
jgi:DNA-binding NtrC family response regulator